MTTKEKILQIKKKYHYTSKQLAEKLGVSQRTVESWLLGENPTTLNRVLLFTLFEEQEF